LHRDGLRTLGNAKYWIIFKVFCRFGHWTSDECQLEECVEAHTNVDIVVDVGQLKAMLDARLPRVFMGESVAKLKSVWPDRYPDGPQPWKVLPGSVS
jgi:hypothetical protein